MSDAAMLARGVIDYFNNTNNTLINVNTAKCIADELLRVLEENARLNGEIAVLKCERDDARNIANFYRTESTR